MAANHLYAPDGDLDAEGGEDERSFAEAMGTVITKLADLAREAVRKRTQIEERWLEDERFYRGRYDETTEANLAKQSTKSRSIINMTGPKTNAWAARLGDLLFPADDRNWGIGPTPVPELIEQADRAQAEAAAADEEAARLVEEHNRRQETGEAPDQSLLPRAATAGERAVALRDTEATARHTMDIAKKRSEAMQREMDDQLTECQYPKRSRDIIDDACRLGSGIIKGPLFANRPRRKWTQAKDSAGNILPDIFRLEGPQDDRPEYLRVDPWAFFPDPNARSMEDAEYTFERHLPNKSQLRKLTKELGFDQKAVRELLQVGPGNHTDNDLQHLTHLRSITNEGEAITGRFVLWEYHGILEKEDIICLLNGMGRHDDATRFEEEHDDLDELRVVIWFCEGHLLKIKEDYVLDSNETLYSVFSFEKSEASVLGGVGVPCLMRDPARALAAAWRMMLDNAALGTGPQVVIDKTQVEPEDGNWKLTGRKVWKRTGQDMGSPNRPFETFDIPVNQQELAGIIELALKFIDEQASMPLIAQGEQGAHISQTMGGMSMLLNSANVIFRRVVKNWDDDLTTPVVRRLYDWNMQFSKKPEVKGDMSVEARGTSVLLVREIQSQNLMAIATGWSTHPVLGIALKAYDAMRMTLQSLSINPDDVLITRDDYEKKLKQMAEGQAQSPEEIRAASAIEVAKITAESRAQDGQVQLQIAELRRETEMLQLAQQGQLSLAQIQAALAGKKMEIDSKERGQAVDIAIEAERERRAVAAGQPPSAGSGKEIG